MHKIIEEFELKLTSSIINLDKIQSIVDAHPYNKVKREKSTPQRYAINDHLEIEYDVKIPKNYSTKRAIEFTEMYVIERQRIRDENENLKIITPFDILRGDTSVLDYDGAGSGFSQNNVRCEQAEREALERLYKQGLAPVGTRPKDKVVESNLPTHIQKQLDVELLKEQSNFTSMDGSAYDVIVPPYFIPTIKLNLRTPAGKPCATMSHVLIDEIISLGSLWKLKISNSRYHQDLMSLIYWIQKDGQIIIRETRNDMYIVFK